MAFTPPSNAAYVRVLLSKAYEYKNDVWVGIGSIQSYNLRNIYEDLEAYGCGLDELSCNKLDFEAGYYEQHVDGDCILLPNPIRTDIKDKIGVVFGESEPLIEVTKNRAVTFVNDNKNPVPSVITYNIIQEG
jgi:hypothetical protein